MPGRRTPPMPERLSPQWAISAFTSVPVALPAAGCTTSPFGLSMTMMSSSSNTIVERDVLGLGRRRSRGGGSATRDGVAGVDAVARIADRARRRSSTAPARISALSRERDSSAIARGEHAVEPLAGVLGGDHDCLAACPSIRVRNMSDPDDEKPLDPAAARIVAKVRWLMVISGVTTMVGDRRRARRGRLSRFQRGGKRAAPADVTAMLPKGARIVATAVAEDRIAVTVEVGRRASKSAPSICARSSPPGGCASRPSRDIVRAGFS